MKKIIIIMMLILLIFTGCRSRAEPKILLDTDSLTISQEGGKIDVYDVESNMTYTFYIRHKKPSNRVLEPYTVTDTPTLRIEQRHKEIILTVKKCKNKYTLRIGKIFPKTSLIKGG